MRSAKQKTPAHRSTWTCCSCPVFCERRAALEAATPCADGPGVSLSEAYRALVGGRGRASCGGCGTRGGQRCGSRSAEGRARYGAPCSQGFDREASALEKGQEVVGRFAAAERSKESHGTED